MTKISKAAKLKACELANAEFAGHRYWQPADFGAQSYDAPLIALGRYVQQVSDAAKVLHEQLQNAPGIYECKRIAEPLAPFILADPVDPLLEAYQAAFPADLTSTAKRHCGLLREELTKRGLQIVETGK